MRTYQYVLVRTSMPSNPSLGPVEHKTISIEKNLKAAGMARAKALRFRGGFSEHVARLIVADLRCKVGVVHRTPRSLKAK